MGEIDALASIASALIAAAALVGAWISWRRSELRRDEVLAWASESIAQLQTLLLICIDELEIEGSSSDRLQDVRFGTSILVERGRMFFRNARPEEYGQDKERAYRGYRPLILDQLVHAHELASRWPNSRGEERHKMRKAAEVFLKKFVSLAQEEVGRSRTVSAYNRQPGGGGGLNRVLAQIEA